MKYTILIAVILLACWKSYSFGVDTQAAREAEQREKLKNEQVEKVRIIYKEKVKIEVKYRDRVKTIYQAADPTGCLNRTLGDVGLLSATKD